MAHSARLCIGTGALALVVSVVNQLTAPQLDPALERSSVLASLLAVGLMLIGVLWTRVAPEPAARVALTGQEGFLLRSDLMPQLSAELAWGSKLLLKATPACVVVCWVGGQLWLRRGLLQATHGTVINDGQVIQLEGDVRIQRLGGDPVTIRAARMRWYPSQQRIELDRRAEATNLQLLLQADRATLLLAQDRLQLRGRPQLQRRAQGTHGASTWSLRVKDLDWSPGSGQLDARGPVIVTDPTSKVAPSTLQASALTGNSIQRRLLLQAPVRLAVPERQAWLQGEQMTMDLTRNSLSSALPFQAAVGGLRISGQGFAVAFDQQLVTLPRGCRLLQRDATLEAGSCRWNWQSERIQADGGVVLKRKVPQQITQADRLSGRLGANGLVVLSAPGSKVRSSLRLRPLSAPGPSPEPAIRP